MAEAHPHNQPDDSRTSHAVAGLLQDPNKELRQQLDTATASLAALQRRHEALSREHTTLRTGVAKISHELKNAVTTVLLIAQRLDRGADGPLSDDQRALLETLATAGRNIASLVEELVARIRGASEGSAPLIESVALADVARRLKLAFSVEAQRRGLAYDVELRAGVPQTLSTDARRLDQILANLVGNALKFTRKGHVHVRFQRAAAQGELQIVVCDTGSGIPEGYRNVIFEPFRRLEPGGRDDQPDGMGLGLAISRDLARELGGDITVVSEIGKGSAFTLHLPIAQGES